MTVESNYAIAIATLSDWLKSPALVYQPMRRKTKTNDLHARFFPRFEQVSWDWFIALFSPAVIGRITLVFVLRHSIENRSKKFWLGWFLHSGVGKVKQRKSINLLKEPKAPFREAIVIKLLGGISGAISPLRYILLTEFKGRPFSCSSEKAKPKIRAALNVIVDQVSLNWSIIAC